MSGDGSSIQTAQVYFFFAKSILARDCLASDCLARDCLAEAPFSLTASLFVRLERLERLTGLKMCLQLCLLSLESSWFFLFSPMTTVQCKILSKGRATAHLTEHLSPKTSLSTLSILPS